MSSRPHPCPLLAKLVLQYRGGGGRVALWEIVAEMQERDHGDSNGAAASCVVTSDALTPLNTIRMAPTGGARVHASDDHACCWTLDRWTLGANS